MNQDNLGALLPLVLLLVLAYFLMIRPARKRAQETAQLQSALSVGDDVMTTSGIFGRVVEATDEHVGLEVATGTVIRVHRGAVGKILTDTPATDAAVGEAEVDSGSTLDTAPGGHSPARDESLGPDDRDQGTR
ncbi:MAG: preprotein translocase subunit YajC [Nocardioidaceae bacterium]|nr:preprotein translocase subunit YajC [Nocardioidaceae bacterium]